MRRTALLPLILLASVGPMTSTIPDMPDLLSDILSLTPGAAMADLVRTGWFGFDGPDATEATLTSSGTWGPASAEAMMARDGRIWRRP